MIYLLTFLKEIESKCLLFHILFYEEIFFFCYRKFFFKCKNVSVTTLSERAAVQ